MMTRRLRRQQGFTLIEVMISFFVLAVGLLGFAALLTSSMTLNQRAYTLSQAMFLAEGIIDTARANRNAISSYALTRAEAPVSSAGCNSNTCTETDLAEWDQLQWMTAVEATLPSGDAQIEVDTSAGATVITVTIYYSLKEGREGTGDANVLAALENYSVSTEI